MKVLNFTQKITCYYSYGPRSLIHFHIVRMLWKFDMLIYISTSAKLWKEVNINKKFSLLFPKLEKLFLQLEILFPNLEILLLKHEILFPQLKTLFPKLEILFPKLEILFPISQIICFSQIFLSDLIDITRVDWHAMVSHLGLRIDGAIFSSWFYLKKKSKR